MKKCSVLVIIVAILLLVPLKVDATTINDYKNKIAALEKEKAESEAKSESAQKKIDDAEARIAEIARQIVDVQKNQKSLRAEIKELEKEIKVKDKEIKELMTFYQISENDNFYLKFVFGAESFEDFIYRFSVAEQLTDANDRLMDEMNDLISKNEKKIKELKKQEGKLNELNESIAKEIEKLGSQKKKYDEDALDVDEEIAVIEKQIAYFKEKGCSDNQEVSTCSVGIVPSLSGFQLPLEHGVITTYFGFQLRDDIGETVARMHSGIDFGAGCGTNIMATNAGEVIFAGNNGDGYGNYVMIAHNANGNIYTSLYGHMSYLNVSQGQTVDRGQSIGGVGNTGYSFGCHLHFQMMYGTGYGTPFNPMSLMDIPSSW